MKTIFSDKSTIAHMWANKTQDSASYTGGNFYYDGNTIYSYGYHFPIATHTERNGVKAVLFTLRSYSPTTSNHISTVKQACRHLNIIYCYRPDESHEKNFDYWLTEAESAINKLKTARKPEKYLNELAVISGQVTKYAEFFELQIPKLLQDALSVSNKEEYTKYLSDKAAAMAEEQRIKELKEKKAHKKALSEWEAGRTSRLYLHDGWDYLRTDLEGGCVQTSQGVEIIMNVAKRFWEKVKDNSLKAGDKIADAHGHSFEVTEADNIIKIGCHTFKRDYILNFGKKLFVDKVV